jgi:hypothetical protein
VILPDGINRASRRTTYGELISLDLNILDLRSGAGIKMPWAAFNTDSSSSLSAKHDPAAAIIQVFPMRVIGRKTPQQGAVAQQAIPVNQRMAFLDLHPAACIKNFDANIPVKREKIIYGMVVPVRMGDKAQPARIVDCVDSFLRVAQM